MKAKNPFNAEHPTLRQRGPGTESAITQQEIARAQMLPKELEESDFAGEPVAGRPGRDHACCQAEQGDQAHDRKATAWLLDRLLRESFLIFWCILQGERRTIDGQDAVATPSVLLGHDLFGFLDHALVNLLEDLHRNVTAALAVGTGFIRGNGASVESTGALGLADGFAAGAADLGHLPEKSPKDQAQIPTAIAGVGLFFLLSQPVAGNPWGEERFELVEGGAGGRAQAMDLCPEGLRPRREVRCHLGTVLILSY